MYPLWLTADRQKVKPTQKVPKIMLQYIATTAANLTKLFMSLG